MRLFLISVSTPDRVCFQSVMNKDATCSKVKVIIAIVVTEIVFLHTGVGTGSCNKSLFYLRLTAEGGGWVQLQPACPLLVEAWSRCVFLVQQDYTEPCSHQGTIESVYVSTLF